MAFVESLLILLQCLNIDHFWHTQALMFLMLLDTTFPCISFTSCLVTNFKSMFLSVSNKNTSSFYRSPKDFLLPQLYNFFACKTNP